MSCLDTAQQNKAVFGFRTTTVETAQPCTGIAYLTCLDFHTRVLPSPCVFSHRFKEHCHCKSKIPRILIIYSFLSTLYFSKIPIMAVHGGGSTL